jgi:hypothetical protein
MPTHAADRAVLVAALEDQQRLLYLLLGELGRDAAIPRIGRDSWHGPARWAFDRALDVVHETVRTSSAAMEQAAELTGVALATIAGER